MKILRIKLNSRKNTCLCSFKNNESIFEIELNYDIVLKYKLSLNKTINQNQFDEINFDNQKFNARTQGYRYATYKRRTEFEISQKLLEKGFDKKIINEVVEFLNDFKLINDNDYAKIFIADKLKMKLWGYNRIKVELLKRGIREEIILNELSNANLEETDFSNALNLANKKYNQIKYKKNEAKINNSILSYLQRNGYNYNIIKEVLNTFNNID